MPTIIVLDGHTLNPGDLSWDELAELTMGIVGEKLFRDPAHRLGHPSRPKSIDENRHRQRQSAPGRNPRERGARGRRNVIQKTFVVTTALRKKVYVK